MAALAGANLIYGLGMIESGMTFDFGQLVMDNEFARMIKFAVGGIPVTDETLSVDVIKEVGPFSDFLSHEKYLPVYANPVPAQADRPGGSPAMEAAGKTDLHQRALAQAVKILETHVPPHCPRACLKNCEKL